MTQELSHLVQPSLYRTNGIPYFFDGNRNWPLIVDTDEITQMICEKAIEMNDEECINELTAMTTYFLELKNLEDRNFDRISVSMVYKWFKSYIEYISLDIYYEIISEMNPDNIFGFVYFDNRRKMDGIKTYIMNDFSTLMYAHKTKGKLFKALKGFRFFEEDFWTLINPYFFDFYNFFGGWNVKRKVYNKYRPLYRIGLVIVEGSRLNHEKYPNVKYITERELSKNIVSIIPVEEVQGFTKLKDNREIIIEDGVKSEDSIRLFEYSENYNFATMLTFERFQKFKYLHRDDPSITFMRDCELPIDWYIEEDGMRFQKFKGKIIDNNSKLFLDGDDVVNMLNMLNNRLERHAKVEDRPDLKDIRKEIEKLDLSLEKETVLTK